LPLSGEAPQRGYHSPVTNAPTGPETKATDRLRSADTDFTEYLSDLESTGHGYPYTPEITIPACAAYVEEDVRLGPTPKTIVPMLGLITVVYWVLHAGDAKITATVQTAAGNAVRAWAEAGCKHGSHPFETGFTDWPDDPCMAMGCLNDPKEWINCGFDDMFPDHTEEQWRCPRNVAGFGQFIVDELAAG
jgi:hypothetical protein